MARINSVQQRLRLLLADRRGATAVEYGLIVAIISGALILGLESVRDNLQTVFRLIFEAINGAL